MDFNANLHDPSALRDFVRELSSQDEFTTHFRRHDDISSLIRLDPRLKSFSCANCGSKSFITSSKSSKPASQQRFRYALLDGKKEKVCNRCGMNFEITLTDEGLYWYRNKKLPSLKVPGRCKTSRQSNCDISDGDIESTARKILKEVSSIDFALLKDLLCSCGCSFRYIGISDLNVLTGLDSSRISQLASVATRGRFLKLSGARKASQEFKDYILDVREQFKSILCLKCLKKMLLFSNGLIYKKKIVYLENGMAKKGLSPLEERQGKKKYSTCLERLQNWDCCRQKCGSKLSLPELEKWRNSYQRGSQDERWQVIQAMKFSNERNDGKGKCVNFITAVTGCSRNLCAAVERTIQARQIAGPTPPYGKPNEYRNS